MSDYKNLSDQQLIVLLSGSDHQAFIEIYDRYYFLVLKFCIKKLSDEEQAKDMIQELFTEIWHKRKSLINPENLPGYLIGSARYKILDFFSHQKVQAKHLQSIEISSVVVNNTDHLVRENELKTFIEKAIQELPYKMREVFELSRNQHLKYKEISKTLSISENTVENQMVNAIKRLKSKFGLSS